MSIKTAGKCSNDIICQSFYKKSKSKIRNENEKIDAFSKIMKLDYKSNKINLTETKVDRKIVATTNNFANCSSL